MFERYKEIFGEDGLPRVVLAGANAVNTLLFAATNKEQTYAIVFTPVIYSRESCVYVPLCESETSPETLADDLNTLMDDAKYMSAAFTAVVTSRSVPVKVAGIITRIEDEPLRGWFVIDVQKNRVECITDNYFEADLVARR